MSDPVQSPAARKRAPRKPAAVDRTTDFAQRVLATYVFVGSGSGPALTGPGTGGNAGYWFEAGSGSGGTVGKPADNASADLVLVARSDGVMAADVRPLVRLSVTVGTAASLISAQLWGCLPRYLSAQGSNQAGVAQVV